MGPRRFEPPPRRALRPYRPLRRACPSRPPELPLFHRLVLRRSQPCRTRPFAASPIPVIQPIDGVLAAALTTGCRSAATRPRPKAEEQNTVVPGYLSYPQPLHHVTAEASIDD